MTAYKRMDKTCWWQLLVAALLFASVAYARDSSPSREHVLIINSYHPGYGWSDGEMHGLLIELTNGRPGLLPSIEYLDWRRFPSPEREELLLKALVQKYARQPLDLIITLDDPALQFVINHRNELAPGTPIVFAGVNFFTPELLHGQRNITGVAEGKDIAGTIELILRLQPATREITVINDLSESAPPLRQALERAMPQFASRVKFQVLDNWTSDALLKSLERLSPRDAVLIMSATIDANQKLLSGDPEFELAMKQHSRAPVFMMSQSLYTQQYRDNAWTQGKWIGVGGMMMSSVTHGAIAAHFALRVLQGEHADQIPIQMSTPSRAAVDYQEMERFHLPLSALPLDAEIYNRPVSFYKQHRATIVATLLVIAALFIVVIVLTVNILQRRRAEVAMRQSNERFQLIAKATNDAVWDWHPGSGLMWWNESYQTMLGLQPGTRQEFDEWISGIHPEERDRIVTEITARGDALTWRAEHRIVRRNGETGYVLNRAYFVRDAAGSPTRVMGAMQDITQRKQIEQEMRRLVTAVEQSSEIILVMDDTGAIEYANPAFERLTGHHRGEVYGRSYGMIFQPEAAINTFEHMVEVIRKQDSWSGQLQSRRPSGETLLLSAGISPIRDGAGVMSSLVLVARDVTNETRLEEQMRFSQKMEAVGLLAGGVAHDFNNLLQVIQGFTQFAMEQGITPAERETYLSKVQQAAARAQKLTQQLLAFGRRQSLTMEDIDLNALVPEMLTMLERLIGRHITIEFVPEANLHSVRANRGQIEQVLMNLCVNARDAMNLGGRLIIALRNVSFDGRYCESHTWARPGEYVAMSVTDTGTGMDAAVLKRIFDPFFSTKPKEKGSGLGLSVVYGIVTQHQGFIHPRSSPGEGSTFTVYLPIAKRNAWPGDRVTTATAAKGSGTLLLVEDDSGVRDVAVQVLQRGGYTVLTASDGIEGIEMFRAHFEEVDLVVLDLIMPRLGGRDTYERLVALKPGLPVLFCSGYGADTLEDSLTHGKDIELIQKPYSSDELLLKVQMLLNRARLSERSDLQAG